MNDVFKNLQPILRNSLNIILPWRNGITALIIFLIREISSIETAFSALKTRIVTLNKALDKTYILLS